MSWVCVASHAEYDFAIRKSAPKLTLSWTVQNPMYSGWSLLPGVDAFTEEKVALTLEKSPLARPAALKMSR